MIKLTEPLVFITGNLHKVQWTKRYIHVPMIHKKLDLTEIQSLDMYEVAEHKAREAYRILGKPIMVEDTSLVIHAWGKLPGTLIKWFLQELGSKGICRAITDTDRSATATVIFAIFDGKNMHFCDGQIKGHITDKPYGDNGFGWNNIFIPEGKSKTYAQMTDAEFDEVSIHKIALEKLRKIV